MQNSLVVSIDSSTTSCKAIAWDAEGNAICQGRSAYPMLRPHAGWAEQNAEAWWTSACAALRECVAQLVLLGYRPSQIEALGITHQRETFVPVDEACRPTRNAILWLDERSRRQLEWLDDRYGSETLHDLTGKPPSLTQSLPKIVWLMQNEPDIVRDAHKLVDVHAFLTWRLTGQQFTSSASADPMALVDMRRGVWADELITDLGLHLDQFVEIVQPGEIMGTVTEASALSTGLPVGIPVVAGAGDGQCAGLGTNALSAGRAYLNMGTGIASGVISHEYRADRAFRTLNAPVQGRFYLEHILRGGVFTVAWFVDKFASDLLNSPEGSAEELMEKLASQVPPGSQGLIVLPYWNGVMNPYWDPSASGVTIGWSGDHGREHLYRAILEGIAYEQRLVGDAMMHATCEPFEEYVMMGGGSQSTLWRQIMADITGVSIVRSNATEATCLGAGILAASAVGWYHDVPSAATAMTSTSERTEPNMQFRAIYESLYSEVYKPLYPTLQSTLRKLRELSDTGSSGR